MTDWITDRQPTEADADKYGEVVLRRHADGRPNAATGTRDALVDWRHIGPGVPWKRTGIWRPPAQVRPTLAVGQVWRRADGDEAVVIKEEPLKDRFFVSHQDCNVWHNADGRSVAHFSHPELELVELISGPPPQRPALTVGQVWRRRDGKEVEICSHNTNHCFGKTHPFWADGRSYKPSGRYLVSEKEDPLDLVELVSGVPEKDAKPSMDFNTTTITLGPLQIESHYHWVMNRAKLLAHAINCSLEAERIQFVHDTVLELQELIDQLQEHANHD